MFGGKNDRGFPSCNQNNVELNSYIFISQLFYQAPLTCDKPASWTHEENPSYAWQCYYLWANLEVLNRVRKSKGLNTLAFRPHAGETGDTMHLASTYMLCRSINHGINLDRQVSLQYLYYLDQVIAFTSTIRMLKWLGVGHCILTTWLLL